MGPTTTYDAAEGVSPCGKRWKSLDATNEYKQMRRRISAWGQTVLRSS